MKNKTITMKHPGTVKIVTPRKTEKVLVEDKDAKDYGEYREVEIEKERTRSAKLPAGTTYGGYPIGRDVEVPERMVAALESKGFKIVKGGS